MIEILEIIAINLPLAILCSIHLLFAILLKLCVLISNIDSFALLYTTKISMDVKIGLKRENV